MNTHSSAGSIPAGLTLYTFEYPEAQPGCPYHGNPEQQFLENDTAAMAFALNLGALRAVNVLSGRVIRARTRE